MKQLTVNQATHKAFKQMKKEFHPLTLISLTRKIVKRPKLMDGTVLRELRYLREEGKCKYSVNHKNFNYIKK